MQNISFLALILWVELLKKKNKGRLSLSINFFGNFSTIGISAPRQKFKTKVPTFLALILGDRG